MSDGPLIYSYSRAQAIEDGMLVPVSDLVPDEPDFSREAGWRWPVALTSAVADMVLPSDREREEWAQSVKGRLWDVLMMASFAVKRLSADTSEVPFKTIFRFAGRPDRPDGAPEVDLRAVVGPGDDAEPVITVMLPGED